MADLVHIGYKDKNDIEYISKKRKCTPWNSCEVQRSITDSDMRQLVTITNQKNENKNQKKRVHPLAIYTNKLLQP